MAYRKLLILGGYGTTGRLLAAYLLQETELELVLAGRTRSKAEAVAARLNAAFPGSRVSTAYADAATVDSLREPFAAVDAVVVASSTAAHARTVAGAALVARSDYLDVQYAAAKTQALHQLGPAIREAGCCFVTDGGFHPGLPAALVRHMAPCFDRLEKANVASVIKIDWSALQLSETTMIEFVQEFLDFQALVLRQGQWQQLGLLAMMMPRTFDFGDIFGRSYCVPMFLEELRALPTLFPGLQETGFYVGGFNWFADWFISPLVVAGLKVAPRRGLRPLARLFHWSLKAFSRPPYGTLLKVDAEGIKEGKPQQKALSLYHEDGYHLTAIPVVATILQLLDGSARKPGLFYQAHIVEPARLLTDMARMGVTVKE